MGQIISGESIIDSHDVAEYTDSNLNSFNWAVDSKFNNHKLINFTPADSIIPKEDLKLRNLATEQTPRIGTFISLKAYTETEPDEISVINEKVHVQDILNTKRSSLYSKCSIK